MCGAEHIRRALTLNSRCLIMDCLKITFTPKTVIEDEEKITELFWDYLNCLRNNGQIYNDYTLIKDGVNFIVYATVIEECSLDEKYCSIYALKFKKEIYNLFTSKTEIAGKNMTCDEPCDCKEKPSWYMLYEDYKEQESPVWCGRCHRIFPLYKLLYLEKQEDHWNVGSWKHAYQLVDSLFMNCLSDRFTYRQMNKLDSQLSKHGREICTEFEKIVGIPFFYYVYYHKNTPSKCPSCGGDWKVLDEIVDYKCDKCRIVADNN